MGIAFDDQGRLFVSSDASGEIYVVVRDETANGSSIWGSGVGSGDGDGDGDGDGGGKGSEGVRGRGMEGAGWAVLGGLVGLVVV